MYRLLAIVTAGLVGAAIWRRKEIRSDAERASKALAGAATSARSRIRPDQEQGDDDGEATGDGEATEADPEEAVEQPADVAASSG